jgi:hypothetical protein
MGMAIWWRILEREGEEEAEHCVPPGRRRIHNEAEREANPESGKRDVGADGEPSALAMPGERENRHSNDAILPMQAASLLEGCFQRKSPNLEENNSLARLLEMLLICVRSLLLTEIYPI